MNGKRKDYINPNRALPKEKRALRAKKRNIVRHVRSMHFPEMSLRQCAQLVNGVFHTIGTFLKSGVGVTISNFGTFIIQERSPRCARNVRTGEAVHIGPTRKVVFIASPVIKNKLKGTSVFNRD